MDEKSDNYIKHKKIELDFKNCQIGFNNGYAPLPIRSGNTGTESINSIIGKYVFNFYSIFIRFLSDFYLIFINILEPIFIIHGKV